MPVTIKDVAALAGVSPSTVSRTCKDHPSISRQTKEKVRQAMAKLGYEPNFRPAVWRPRIPAPWNHSATVGVGGLPESILSGDDTWEPASTATRSSTSIP
ncbi:MAG: LacI family DNA-binding transcriptional regulator [Enterocloster bolteae]